MHHSVISCVSVLLFSLFLSIVHYVHCRNPLVRQTKNGPVEGVEMETISGQTFYAFKTIPYANPPITGRDPYTGEIVDRRFKVR